MRRAKVVHRNARIHALTAAMLLGLTLSYSQQEARLSAYINSANEVAIAIQPAIHVRFGCQYPMTYQIEIPVGSSGLTAERRRAGSDVWEALPEKTSNDLFNAIEAVRFDYAGNRALVSAAFADGSDSLFIRITGSGGVSIVPRYGGITRYYDDRRAAVTVTGDDCADWSSAWFPSILSAFRSNGLYVTVGIITGNEWCSSPTWSMLQKEVDSGYVELASHSRTHAHIPYADPAGEVQGSVLDIVNTVHLPALFASGNRHYVYVWIAPYGDYDATVDSLVSIRKYIVPRVYNNVGDSTFSVWEAEQQHFAPINPTLEIGAPGWGGGTIDTSFLNGTFDAIVDQGGIYHFMWHPQVIGGDLDKPYFVGHLNHVSHRTDIWYVNLGHLYVYHMVQLLDSSGQTAVSSSNDRPKGYGLSQNYPNPFNPTTGIRFQLPGVSDVRLSVYDLLGREVAVLVNERKVPGSYEVKFDGSHLASGVYFYRISAVPMARRDRVPAGGRDGYAGSYVETRKFLLVR